MATDKELLELAAKAAGVSIIAFTDFGNVLAMPSLIVHGDYWNPLHDDGDEARLEATLQLHVEWHPARSTVSVGTAEVACIEPYGKDRQAARRRAGTRAAAEIGRSMLSTDQTR